MQEKLPIIRAGFNWVNGFKKGNYLIIVGVIKNRGGKWT